MPKNNAAAHFLVRSISKPYLRFAEGVRRIEISGMEHYEEAIRGFLEGKWRLIIPFRHVSKADAAVIGTVFGRIIPDRFKVKDRRFWISFLYGDMVLDWAGAAARWLFPRIDALPVSNQSLVREQILAIRQVLRKGDYPLCMAPEGQVNYYNDRPGPLTEGLSHFIKWIIEEESSVKLLPVTLYYRYRKPQRLIDRALGEVSSFTGSSCANLDEALAVMLGWLREYLSPGEDSTGAPLEEIWNIIIREAREAYPIGGRKPLAELFLFRHHLFRDMRSRAISVPALAKRIAKQWQEPAGLSPLEKNYQRQQILDILLNFDPEYHRSGSSPLEEEAEAEALNRGAEQALYLLDMINRIRGGDINSRFFPAGTTAVVRFCSPRLFKPGDDPEQWKSIFYQTPFPASGSFGIQTPDQLDKIRNGHPRHNVVYKGAVGNEGTMT